MTMADHADQYFSFQDKLFQNEDGKLTYKGSNPTTVWPGDGKPGLWMHSVSRMSRLIYSSVQSEKDHFPVPPVFDNCKVILTEENERRARDLYWDVVCNKTEESQQEEALKILQQAYTYNPFIAEPHALRAQILLSRKEYDAAHQEATSALKLFIDWGTCWDKRISWEGWVSWVRVLVQSGRKKEWPNTAWGIINLGLVE